MARLRVVAPIAPEPQFEIIKGAPIPLRRNAKYPFDKMEIGDSFLVPGGKDTTVRGPSIGYSKRHGGKFAIHVVKGGVQVWRTA